MSYASLGERGPRVSRIGLGCMGMSEFYGTAEESESLRTIYRALDLGINFFDTADVYGRGGNEVLLGRALRGRRAQAIVATKFGIVRDASGRFLGRCGRADYVRACCEASLRRLALDRIDLYYCHRLDPSTPLEETVGAMAGLVAAGKVDRLGLCEVSADELSRAHHVHPIAAVQSELSLLTPEPEPGIVKACRERDAAFVAFSPLGRGLLTGGIRSRDDLAAGDWRLRTPDFQSEALRRRAPWLARLEALAARKHCTAAQLALAWVLDLAPHVVAIPGTRSHARLEENLGALQVEINDGDRVELGTRD